MAVRYRALLILGLTGSAAAVCRPSCASAQASGVMQATVTVLPASVGKAQIAGWIGAAARLPTGHARSLDGEEPGIRTNVERRPARPEASARRPEPATLLITVTYLR